MWADKNTQIKKEKEILKKKNKRRIDSKMRYWSPQHSQNQVIKAQCSYHSFIIQTQSDLIFQKIMEGETFLTHNKFTIERDKKKISSIYSVAFNQKSTQMKFELKHSYFWSASKETLMLSYIFSLSAWACLKQIVRTLEVKTKPMTQVNY